MIQTDRHLSIAPRILFLDGLSGTGKTMMGAILTTFDRVEVQRLEHIYEYVCALRYLERMESDAADVLIRMYVDLACYNLMIGREVNFRWKDLSGVLSNPGGLRYVKRLFEADGNSVIGRVEQINPIVQIVSHQALGIGRPLFDALGSRLRVVEMVRHPLYLIEHWHSYINRFGTDARDFSIWIKRGDSHLPWFACGWEDRYVSSNTMDRVIYTIESVTARVDQFLSSLDDAERQNVLVIPFEQFVVRPDAFTEQIAVLLGSRTTPATLREMRKQKVPRQLTTDGRDLGIYRRYNWRPPEKGNTEESELKKRWDYAGSEASAKGMAVLESICSSYESRYFQTPAGSATGVRKS